MNAKTPLMAFLVALFGLMVPVQAEVLCSGEGPNNDVRATAPSSHYEIHDDGTVTHLPTGLMWMRCPVGMAWSEGSCTGDAAERNWRAALNHVVTFNQDGGFAGYQDWRVPNKNELESIAEHRCWRPAINAEIFPNTPTHGTFWTSSPHAKDNPSAWGVFFDYGAPGAVRKDFERFVRLVRAGN